MKDDKEWARCAVRFMLLRQAYFAGKQLLQEAALLSAAAKRCMNSGVIDPPNTGLEIRKRRKQ